MSPSSLYNSRKRLISPWILAALATGVALGVVPQVTHASFFSGIDQQFSDALSSGNYALSLGLVYLIGLSTALTPCVYPMIAITVSIFGAKQAKSRAHSMGLSTAFVLGIATLFTPLGVAAGLTGGLFAAWLNSPVVLIGFAILFVALALSMFGAYEMNLPPSIQNRLAEVGGVGPRGAFAMGMVSALIAAPCTGPGFLALLTWIGNTRNVGFGAAATFVYSLGLGTLFWIVGTFSISLPKSGRWMDAVKSVFGIVMCIMALYYVRDLMFGLMDKLVHDEVLLTASLLILAVGLALLAATHLDRSPQASTAKKVRKVSAILLSTIGGFLLICWMIVPPPGGLVWREDFAQAIAQARQQHKPYVVDFGASWCGACGELERDTFTDPRVVREGARFVAVHVDLSPDQDSPEKRALLASYNQRGLPLVVFHDHDGREVSRLTTFEEPGPFVARMRAVR